MPVDKAVVFRSGSEEERAATIDLPEEAAVVADAPEALKDKAAAYREAFALFLLGKGKATFAAGAHISILAAGPRLDSPDQAAVAKLTRRDDRLDLELVYTSATAMGLLLKRNVTWRPLVQVPVDLPAGTYSLTVTWRAVAALPDGKGLDVMPSVSKYDFVVEDGRKESKPVRVNGVDFIVVADGKVTAPPAGGKQPMELGLRIHNASDNPVVVYDTLRLKVTTADGKDLPFGAAADATRKAKEVPLAPGKDLYLSANAQLVRSADGKTLRLNGSDGFGLFWWCEDLKPGKYLVTADYQIDKSPDPAKPFWLGKVKTDPATFEIVGP
jgi:hypothetical protein